MICYTLSSCVLKNIDPKDKLTIVNFLMYFPQDANPYKLVVDREGRILDIYHQIAASNPGLAYWLTLMSDYPKSWEVIDTINACNGLPEYEVFLYICSITDDKKFARDVLHATNILIVPGSGFEWNKPDHFRIVMLPQANVLKNAIHELGKFLDGYKQK